MSHFAPPQADPHSLRAAAGRLLQAGRTLDVRSAHIASTGTATLSTWQGSASVLMAARAREMRRVTQQQEQALGTMAQATDRYAVEVEQAMAEVRRLNDLWDEAVRNAQQQASAAAAARAAAARETALAASRAAAAGNVVVRRQAQRTYDDGSAAFDQTQAQLEQRYRRLVDDLEADGYSLQRALASRDPVTLLPSWLAGGAYAGEATFRSVTTGMRAVKLAKYGAMLFHVSRFFDLGHKTIVAAIQASPEYHALKAALYGKTYSTLFVGKGMTAAGKVFLPLTLVSGLNDIRTGGGYAGWRDPATRVAGAVGAAGAGALLISASPILFTLGPVGLGVAGAAVIGYGVWSAGNFIYDHRDAIGYFGVRVRGAAVDAAVTQTAAAVETIVAAKDVLVVGAGAVTQAAGEVVDAGRRVVDVITNPTKLLPKLGGLF